MAELVPVNFPQPPSNDIRSFSFTDMISNTAYLTLYAGQTNTAATLGLSVFTFYGDNVTFKTSTFTASVTPTKTTVMDRDYDIKINQPMIIEGLCFVNVPNGVNNGDSAGQTHEHLVLVKLRKWDGTTETEIASATGRTHTNTTMAINTEADTIDALSFVIASPVKINSGESLRLTVQINHSAGGAVNSKVFIGQDPKNRAVDEDAGSDGHNWGNLSTQLTLLLPVRYDF